MPPLQTELILAVAAVVIGVAFPRFGGALFAAIETRAAPLISRPRLACVTVSLLTLVIRLALLPLLPVPEPTIHDEFSYLLAGDTFSQGRLTNPTHPKWVHFETIHVSHEPTYMSQYPPAQGIVLAAGKLLTGEPWFGVLFVMAILCGALTWALQGWLPPGWALFGGLWFMVRVGLFSYWMNSYYGAAITALGGAIVIGALPRLLRGASTGTGAALGCGAIILANSRPYEGFLLCLVVAVTLAVKLRRGTVERRRTFARRALLPAVLILASGAAAIGYYNFRVFGNPLILPYQSYRATYAPAPIFLWQKPGPIPEYRHQVLRDFFVDYELATFRKMTGPSGPAATWLICSLRWWIFFLYPLLSVALLLGLPWLVTSKPVRLVWLLLLVPAAGVAGLAFNMAHYFAPAVAAFYVLLVQSMRLAQERLWASRGVGRGVVRNLGVVALAMACVVPFHVHDKFLFGASGYYWFPPIPGRAAVIQKLQQAPGRDLVIVRYNPDHDAFQEWVYNDASIDSAEIVWAREMDAEKTRGLISYFRGRNIWLLEADERPPKLVRYPESE